MASTGAGRKSPMLRGIDSDVLNERTEPALKEIMRNTATPLPMSAEEQEYHHQHHQQGWQHQHGAAAAAHDSKHYPSYDKKGDDEGVSPGEEEGSSAADFRDGAAGRQRADDDEGQLKRALHTRHVVFLAIAGIIGPGLLVGSGNALATAGPAGSLIAFALVGFVVYAVMQCLGEMATALPIPGSFITYCTRFVDPALGSVVGLSYWLLWVCVLANEYVASALLVRFWPAAQVVPTAAWIMIFWVFFMGFSFLGVFAFAEAEFVLATIKVLFLVAFFILSIVISAGGTGQPAVGFSYYHNPGPFVGTGTDAFAGIVTIFVTASTLYAGVEMTAVVAAESRNPTKAVPYAIRSVFFRIVFLYLGTLFFISITVPYNDPRLVSASSRAGSSPLTIAMQRGGIEVAANVVNAIIIVSVVSAANSSLYVCSRTLQSMATKGQMPKLLGYTTKKGKVPVPALVVSNVFALISLLSIGTGTAKAFRIIINLSGVLTFLVWGCIAIAHLRFRAAMKAQNHDARKLLFRTRWWPYGTWFALVANIVLTLIQGYTAFLDPFNLENFLVAYILLPVFFIYYFGWKILFRTKILKAHEIDIDTGRRDIVEPRLDDEEQIIESEQKKPKGIKKIGRVLNRIIA